MYKTVKITYPLLCGLILILFLLSGIAEELVTHISPETNGEETAIKIPAALQSAFKAFKNYALFYDKKQPLSVQNALALNAYLKRMDPTSEYLEPDEYSIFATSFKDNFVGIGMEIEKHETGKILCFPYPGSPAYWSGVRKGDVLDAVDGVKVTGHSVYVVASKMMGKTGTKASLIIINKKGVRRHIEVTRKQIAISSVTAAPIEDLYYIKIHTFSRGTKRDLKSALSELPESIPIILDLRNNPGGDLHKAIDSAMLFLEKDVKIVSIKGRHGTKAYNSTTPAANYNPTIYIWQNEHTASAAEVFIAALTMNNRAESIGRKSFGKGITQDVVELDDGSAIIFAAGYLITPDNRTYHKNGLEPTHLLEGDQLGMNEYLLKTNALLKTNKDEGRTK